MNHQEVSKKTQIYQDKEIFCLKEEAESKVSIEQGPNSPPENSKLPTPLGMVISHIYGVLVFHHTHLNKKTENLIILITKYGKNLSTVKSGSNH